VSVVDPAEQTDLQRYPVLVIPGYGAPGLQTEAVSRRLRAQGLDTVKIKLPWMAMGDMVKGAHIVSQQAERTMGERGFEKVNLFGFSLGGLVAKYYLQELEGYESLGRGAFISTPNAGTYIGYLGFFSPGGWQARPSSPLVRQLNESPVRHTIAGKCISIFVRWDGVIVPCFSSYMPEGYNLMQRRPLSHWRALMNEEIVERASEFLKGNLPEGAFCGRELGMIEAGEVVAVPWEGHIGAPRRFWRVVAKPWRGLGSMIAGLFRRG
jgi:triacylglycerol lipase